MADLEVEIIATQPTLGEEFGEDQLVVYRAVRDDRLEVQPGLPGLDPRTKLLGSEALVVATFGRVLEGGTGTVKCSLPGVLGDPREAWTGAPDNRVRTEVSLSADSDGQLQIELVNYQRVLVPVVESVFT
jgi:hypothetical protein